MKIHPLNIIERPEFHNRTGVFKHRERAGEILAQMMYEYKETAALVLAIPAGGVPVAVRIAKELCLPLDVAVVSKITLPWNSEVGYGAVAFDGTVRLNDKLAAGLGLSEREVEKGIARTMEKVRRRNRLFRDDRAFPDLSDRSLILVDDGLASGFTMLTAIGALRKASSSPVVVAVPTSHSQTVENIAAEADRVYCANIRTPSGWDFAVADAYQCWSDVTEQEVLDLLRNEFSVIR